jgi:hypothetical protein
MAGIAECIIRQYLEKDRESRILFLHFLEWRQKSVLLSEANNLCCASGSPYTATPQPEALKI